MDLGFLSPRSSEPTVQALVANRAGEIYELDGYAAMGMTAGALVPLTSAHTLPLPHGSELMRLPQRRPILYNLHRDRVETLNEDPRFPGEPIYPVAAFNSPGYMLRYINAYEEQIDADMLPMFSYGAVGWYDGGFHSAAVMVDSEPRQDLRSMPSQGVVAGTKQMRQKFPNNRLRAHIEHCALGYGCPAAKNFFLGRHEAPLPTSPNCNAHCHGCLSLQVESGLPVSQERIQFMPTPEEIAEIALAHIGRTPRPVVSFGQGCEGDPLMAANVIEAAIRLIRQETADGTINMNTNGGRPDLLERLLNVGLDSVRISLNSVRPSIYRSYFRPKNYRFDDVCESIDLALKRNRFVSINYLNSPGVTDAPQEFETLVRFIETHPINMIQWRNLNYDPRRYWQIVKPSNGWKQPLGMSKLLASLKRRFPRLIHGYFNPPKEKWSHC